MRGSRFELATQGFDPALQLVGSDPFGAGNALGLRIPPLPSSKTSRFLLMLAAVRIAAKRRIRLVGIRQYVSIGALVENTDPDIGSYPLELQVENPNWHFTDGNISWSLMRVPPTALTTLGLIGPAGVVSINGDNKAFRYSLSPAILFETGVQNAKNDFTSYTPPPMMGQPLCGDLGNFHDLRWPWRNAESQHQAMDIEIQGPCDIALYASVKQTDPGTRSTLLLPGSLPAGTNSLPNEDAFVVNFPTAQYWRVAGSLVFEEEQFFEEPKQFRETYGKDFPPSLQRGEASTRPQTTAPMTPCGDVNAEPCGPLRGR